MAYKKRIPEFQAPDNHILTEKTKFVKDLTVKQLNKSVCLKEELSKEFAFRKSNEFLSITHYTKGEKSLDSYKEFAKLVDNIEELKTYGLTSDEIQFLNDYKQSDFSIKYKNLSTVALQKKLQYVFELIEKGRNKNVTLENNTSQNKLVHPINNLHEINDELFGHLNTKLVVPSLKKRRKRIKKYLETSDKDTDFNININYTNKKTKWDVKEKEINVQSKGACYPIQPKQNIIDINEKDEKINIGGKPFVGFKPNNNILNELDKISINEIRKIPRFKNYEIGIPSKVLFIKNLSKNISEENLVNIFGHFDNDEKKITYRLLSGKMKGQAFITFNNVDQATNALETINGYIYKDKPIIIQYGRS